MRRLDNRQKKTFLMKKSIAFTVPKSKIVRIPYKVSKKVGRLDRRDAQR